LDKKDNTKDSESNNHFELRITQTKAKANKAIMKKMSNIPLKRAVMATPPTKISKITARTTNNGLNIVNSSHITIIPESQIKVKDFLACDLYRKKYLQRFFGRLPIGNAPCMKGLTEKDIRID
jgi:hypothetical protein